MKVPAGVAAKVKMAMRMVVRKDFANGVRTRGARAEAKWGISRMPEKRARWMPTSRPPRLAQMAI